MLCVYYADTSKLPLDKNYELSQYRREKLERAKNIGNKRESLGAELLLIHALKMHVPFLKLPADIICSEKGKPYLPGRELFFSLSHSGGYAACAVSNFEIGLDIQKNEKCREKLIKRYYSADEAEYVIGSPDKNTAFTKIWCMKESFVKATGKGLASGLAEFSVLKRNDIFWQRVGDLHLSLCTPGRDDCLAVKIEKIVIPGSDV